MYSTDFFKNNTIVVVSTDFCNLNVKWNGIICTEVCNPFFL